MTDYINREAVCYQLAKQATIDGQPRAIRRAAKIVADFPAADVRPVVTCGECKYWELSKIEPRFHVCTYVCGATFVRSSEDFCSRGEKREEN